MTVGSQGIEFGRGRAGARAGSAAWLLLVCWPLWEFFSSGPDPSRVVWAVSGVVCLAACWIAIIWRLFSDRSGAPRLWALAGLIATTLALFPVLGPPWANIAFVFVVTALAASLGGVAFVVGVLVTAAAELAVLLAYGHAAWWLPVVVLAQAGAVHSLKQLGHLIARLNTARAQVAQLAVDNERLRFARDLHDTLGHTLTSITIRSQLAARLARTDPDRAAGEMSDVEAAARQALDEVRQAVTGYRAPALSEELDKAAHGLRLAGIDLDVTPAEGPVPSAAEALLAWAVREATTNVLRHSRARRCWIALRVDATTATLEVRDDGRPSRAPGEPGNGLTGLAERVTGAGGRLDVGTLPEGGYRLHAHIPLEVS